MKYLLPILFLALTIPAYSHDGKKGGKCVGAANCRVCKDCSRCKHCTKEGGSCGTCAKSMARKGAR